MDPVKTNATPGATLTGEDSVRQAAESSRPRELLPSNPMVQLLRDWLKGCPNPPEWHWTFDLHVRTVNLLGNIPPENETNAVAVAGDSLTTTLADFEHRATHWLGEEQARANPNNALIALLCDAVRLARENESLARAPLKAFVQLCAPHGKDWLTCPECAKAAGIGSEQA